MSDRDTLIERLTAENDEFRKLREEHRGYEHELEELQARPFLSADQQWRASELKKLKLMAKDRMEAIIRRARQTSSSQATA
ncbi:MAG: YdcH family protein [Candidatus Rokubacteria bacterium]|nr:YdcH family protein [Candidatus Rokubacteria bacterium]